MNKVLISTPSRISAATSRQLLLALFTVLLGLILAGCNAVSSLPSQDVALNSSQGEGESSSATSTPTSPLSPLQTGDRSSAAELEPIQRDGMYDAPPEMMIDPDTYYYATIRTEKGDIRVQLFADRAPNTVNNLVFLAREGFYDNTTFHRVIDGFMAQAGDPAATGAGGPGYQFEDEFYPGLEFDQSGLLAMANRGPGTNGSQFFITLAPTDWLNGGHTIFGKVIEGEDVLAEITRIDPQADAGMVGDAIFGIDIEESDVSILPTPTPSPPTPTPTPLPTPFAPTDLNSDDRPLADIEPAKRANYFNTPPEMVIDADEEYQATIATSQGDIVIQLYADAAPVAVNNFVVLANLGFYDGTPISLVRPDDSVIFGSPDGSALNDAGYLILAELNPDIELNQGVLTYIPVEDRSDETILSSSSQVLIALIEPPSEFQGELGFFGQVVDGMDILPALTTDDTIESITISTED